MGLSRVVGAAARLIVACALLGCGSDVAPNILLVTLDTTRADHLSVYGYPRETTPHLEALARDAILYERAHSTSTWTLPSHASLFTGKLPTSHGARYDPEGPLVLSEAIGEGTGIRARGLAPGETTLAARLRDAGYATAGFAGGPWLLDAFGLSAGFEHWDDEGILGTNGRTAPDLSRAVLEWLASWAEAPERRPFFLFVNFFDAHFPYAAPPEHARLFLPPGVEIDRLARDQYEPLYDAEIHFADEHLGRLLDALRERELYDETLVVVTADHGEMLGEHGEWGHNGIPFEPVTRVPLIVKPPGGAAARVEERPIQLPALFHLVLAAAGQEPAPQVDAQPRVAEVWHPPAPGVGEWKVLWQDELKYLQHGDGKHRLYDLSRDPRERVNRVADRPDDARQLRAALAAALDALPRPAAGGEPQTIDPETLEALERLGYIDGESP